MPESELSEAVEDRIFGGSSSEGEDENEAEVGSEFDESSENASERGKKKGGVVKNKKHKTSQVSEKVLEARREFDEALQKIKGQGNRRKKMIDMSDPAELDDMATAFRRRMEMAADRDNENVQNGKPALEKHKILGEVTEMLNRKHMHEVLLDNGILGSVRLWLEPLANRSLPSASLRKILLEVLRTMPVETDHLRESGVGRIIMYFARREKEVPEVQRIAKELISRWSRPIIGDVGNQEERTNTDSSNVSSQVIRSMAFRQMEGRLQDASGTLSQHRRLAAHLQKKAKTRKSSAS